MIFQPAYFPNIETFQWILQATEVIFEIQEHYQKQTYRTRCSIYSANGLLSMNIPIKHQKLEHQFTKNVKIENDFKWQQNHFKTLQNAYRSSPYFEYYEDDIAKIYENKETYLLDFIFKTIDLSLDLLQNPTSYRKTEIYQPYISHDTDCRNLIDAKNLKQFDFTTYTQVFDSKHGYIPNLSILDLLFNEGPNANNLLKIIFE
jgi:hypothetical protein